MSFATLYGNILEIKKTDTVTKYLVFREIGQKPKTKIYGVYTKEKYPVDSAINPLHLCLGTIYFFANWRQYIFKSYEEPILANSCLIDIYNFVAELNKQLHKPKEFSTSC